MILKQGINLPVPGKTTHRFRRRPYCLGIKYPPRLFSLSTSRTDPQGRLTAKHCKQMPSKDSSNFAIIEYAI